MSQTITAHFDGETIVPHDPVSLPVGQELRVTLEPAVPEEEPEVGPFADLAEIGIDDPSLPTDLSVNHDHYLYGTPKKHESR